MCYLVPCWSIRTARPAHPVATIVLTVHVFLSVSVAHWRAYGNWTLVYTVFSAENGFIPMYSTLLIEILLGSKKKKMLADIHCDTTATMGEFERDRLKVALPVRLLHRPSQRTIHN